MGYMSYMGRAGATAAMKSARRRSAAGFTLAEVLAALLFMAIVIPAAIEGMHIASLAGTVAARKGEAARVAQRLLTESLVTTNWNQSAQSGTVTEGQRQFRWTMRTDPWTQDPTNAYSPAFRGCHSPRRTGLLRAHEHAGGQLEQQH